jgi:hypothetical protein
MRVIDETENVDHQSAASHQTSAAVRGASGFARALRPADPAQRDGELL